MSYYFFIYQSIYSDWEILFILVYFMLKFNLSTLFTTLSLEKDPLIAIPYVRIPTLKKKADPDPNGCLQYYSYVGSGSDPDRCISHPEPDSTIENNAGPQYWLQYFIPGTGSKSGAHCHRRSPRHHHRHPRISR